MIAKWPVIRAVTLIRSCTYSEAFAVFIIYENLHICSSLKDTKLRIMDPRASAISAVSMRSLMFVLTFLLRSSMIFFCSRFAVDSVCQSVCLFVFFFIFMNFVRREFLSQKSPTHLANTFCFEKSNSICKKSCCSEEISYTFRVNEIPTIWYTLFCYFLF